MTDPIQLDDAHAHLDDSVFKDDLEQVLSRANQSGVNHILTVGSDLESSQVALRMARDHPHIWAAIGIHPHEAHKFREESSGIETLINHPKLVAIGETGLDFSRGRSDQQVQIEAFEAQLELAQKSHLPVSIHNRGADREILQILKRIPVTAVLHCYSGSWEFAVRALEQGMYLSFAGNLTYPRATELRHVASQIPIEKALIETDSPVLAPQANRGQRNEPGLLTQTFDTFASLRNMAAEETATALRLNASRVFEW